MTRLDWNRARSRAADSQRRFNQQRLREDAEAMLAITCPFCGHVGRIHNLELLKTKQRPARLACTRCHRSHQFKREDK
jgi:transcription elongation factor Elf1